MILLFFGIFAVYKKKRGGKMFSDTDLKKIPVFF